MDYRVFVDSDVILDVLAKREKFYKNSSIILELMKDRIIKGHTYPVIIANINYILIKYGNRKIAKESIKKNIKIYISPINYRRNNYRCNQFQNERFRRCNSILYSTW